MEVPAPKPSVAGNCTPAGSRLENASRIVSGLIMRRPSNSPPPRSIAANRMKFRAELTSPPPPPARAGGRRNIPTLLVRGLKSDIVDDAGVDDLRRRVPALEVADIRGAGHMVAGDRNDEFNAAVVEFLGQIMPVG